MLEKGFDQVFGWLFTPEGVLGALIIFAFVAILMLRDT